jgi:hypothetical protein
MRPGQHNNKRGRNRNRSRHSGGSGGGGGGSYNGNPANRVFDSNGPDVKLRGTAQTIAEKYMQLGRDAHSSGDSVMAESYYQHSEHYYRLWLANQPAGQPIQFARRNDEEFEEDGQDADDEENVSGETGEAVSEAQPGNGGSNNPEGQGSEDNAPQQDNRQRQRFDQRDNGRDGNRESGRERFRPRWPRRGERPAGQALDDANPAQAGSDERSTKVEPEEHAGNWEAPSFLTRPVPAIAAEDSTETTEPAVQKRPRREFRPRRPRNEDETASESSGPLTEAKDA